MASYFQESQIIANPIGIQDLPIEILAPDAVKLGSSSRRMNGALDMILKDSISYVAVDKFQTKSMVNISGGARIFW